MSLLGTQVFANPLTPLWGNTGGHQINGDVVINGQLQVGGIATFVSEVQTEGPLTVQGNITFSPNNSGDTQIIVPDPTGENLYIQVTDSLQIGKIGALTANTNLAVSAFGSNLDLLTVGGGIKTLSLSLPNAGPGATRGTGTIVVGQANVTIATTAITATSTVLISRMGAPAAGPGNGAAQGNLTVSRASIVPGTSFQATLVGINGVTQAASLVDATFEWVIIG